MERPVSRDHDFFFLRLHTAGFWLSVRLRQGHLRCYTRAGNASGRNAESFCPRDIAQRPWNPSSSRCGYGYPLLSNLFIGQRSRDPQNLPRTINPHNPITCIPGPRTSQICHTPKYPGSNVPSPMVSASDIWRRSRLRSIAKYLVSHGSLYLCVYDVLPCPLCIYYMC